MTIRQIIRLWAPDEPTGGSEVSPAAGTGPAGDDAGAVAQGAAPEGSGEGTGVAGAPPSPPQPDWKDRRMALLQDRNKSMQKDLERQAARIKELEAAPPAEGAAPQASGLPESEVERRAQARAQTLAAEQRFADDCRRVAADGKTKFTDFDARVAELNRLVDQDDPRSVGAFASLVDTAIKTGSGAEVLHNLGGNLNEAERLLRMGPAEQALALSKIASGKAEPVTSAPEPIRRVQNQGPSGSDISPSDPARADKLSTEEWMKRRQAEVDQKRRGAA